MTAIDSVGSDVVVPADRLHDTIVKILVAEGATIRDAAQQASILVEGDLRGQHSHGVRRLPVLVGRLRTGLIRSGTDPDLTWITDAFLRVDGQRGFGPVVGMHAIEAIMERADRTGIAIATVANANHIGMLAPYVERMTTAGQLGIALTTSEALVHPWGSAHALVGTNPIGIGVPTATEPLVLDMSTAAVSMGKVLDHATKGQPIPLGWAVAGDGQPTTDADQASRGALSPFGGPKGYALGVALEAVVGLLTATSFGTDVVGTLDSEEPASKGDVFVAISLDRIDVTSHLLLLQDYLDEVRRSGHGTDMITVPGDRARAMRSMRLADGIPLHPDIWQATLTLLGEEPSS